MKTRAYVHSSNVVSARGALENVDLKRVMSAAASIATLIWHDLEPNMQDEQFLVPMAKLIICFQLNFGIFCGQIWAKNRLYIHSKYVHLNAVLHSILINKINKYSNSLQKI